MEFSSSSSSGRAASVDIDVLGATGNLGGGEGDEDGARGEQEDGAENEEEEEEDTIQIRMQNIVSTVQLTTHLDLDKITQTARNAEYNPKRFQAVIMRIRDPRTTALIFSSGKMIVTGAKSQEESVSASKKFVAIIQKVGFPARFTEYKIQNMTATVDMGFPIRLEGLLYAHAQFATYEPELFPGLIYRMVDPKIVLLIFVSGKVVITGAKSADELELGVENIFPYLLEFRKKNIVVSTMDSSLPVNTA